MLPLPWFIWRFAPKAQVKQASALRIPFFAVLQSLAATSARSTIAPNRKWFIAYLLWVLLVIASAGPQWLGPPLAMPRYGRDIMLAIDLSGSMQIPDLTLDGKQTNRITVVKTIASQFIKDRVGDRLGLILFGTHAYLQTPLTFDRKTVQQMLDDATVGLAGKLTAIGDAIGLAVKRLMQVAPHNRVLVLLTDGVSNAGVISPIQAARLAAQAGVKIYTIGVGADRLVVRGMFGSQVIDPSQDLDESALKRIAQITGGLYFRAKNAQGLQQAYKTIDKLEPTHSGKRVFRPITPLFMWPLGLALLLSIWLALKQVRVPAKTTVVVEDKPRVNP